MTATEVALKQEGEDGAWEQHFCVQTAFCRLCPGVNEGEPLAGSPPVGWGSHFPGDAGRSGSLVAAPPHAPVQKELFQSHLQPGKQGFKRGTPGLSCKTWPRGAGVCARMGCVLCPTCSQSPMHLGKPSPSPACGAGTGQRPPLWAARRLWLVLHGVDGLLPPLEGSPWRLWAQAGLGTGYAP